MLDDAGFLSENPTTLIKRLSETELEIYNGKIQEVNEIYANATEIITNSSILYMFWSNFSLYYCQNKQRSLVLLAECEKRNPLFDERFVIFRQRKIMNEEPSSDNTDMLDFFINESHMKKATRHSRIAVRLQVWYPSYRQFLSG